MATLSEPKTRKKKLILPLTEAVVTGAKPRDTQYLMFDTGSDLHLLIRPNGKKVWRVRQRTKGKDTVKTLGEHPAMPLSHARALASDMKKGVEASFRAVAETWLADNSPRWKPITLGVTTRRLHAYVYPEIGDKPVATVRPSEVLAIVERRREARQFETAARLLQYMTQIFGLACVRYDLSLNPAAEVGRTRLSRPTRKHMKAATMGELGKVLLQMEDYRNRTTADALEFLILTAARTGEVRFATWEEFHGLDDPRKPAEWHIPAERMKMKLPHVVPLSPQAVAVLKRRGVQSTGLVFAEGDEAMSENTMLFALKKRGWQGKITVHGFRTTFSTEANTRGFNPDAIEAAIAHRSMNAVRAIYNRATYSKERRELMEWWGKECVRRKEVAALL